MAAEVVQLLSPHINSSSTRIVTNAAYSMLKLLKAEQQLLQQEQEQQESEQQQQQQLPPVLSAVLEHADIVRFAAPMGDLKAPVNFYQSCMMFWPVLLHSRPAYKALKTSQPQVLRRVIENAACGLAIQDQQALAVNMQTLYLVYRHGGVDVLSKELRPILLKYPVESSSSVVCDVTRAQEGGDILCQGLFLEQLCNAGEMRSDTMQVEIGPVKVWRASALLLRAVWDTTPELRPLYDHFLPRLQQTERSRPSGHPDKVVLFTLPQRMTLHWKCRTEKRDFIQQQDWLAAVKQDAGAEPTLRRFALQGLGR